MSIYQTVVVVEAALSEPSARIETRAVRGLQDQVIGAAQAEGQVGLLGLTMWGLERAPEGSHAAGAA